jgi:hypothetical protein
MFSFEWAVIEKNIKEICFADSELLVGLHFESTEEVFAGLEGGEKPERTGFPPAEGYVTVEPGFSDAVPEAGDKCALKEILLREVGEYEV